MPETEAETIRQRILNEGRSPTIIVRCESDHELLVTLYNLRTGEGLGVRDVVVAHRTSDESSSKKKETTEMDWLAKAFGGDE